MEEPLPSLEAWLPIARGFVAQVVVGGRATTTIIRGQVGVRRSRVTVAVVSVSNVAW